MERRGTPSAWTSACIVAGVVLAPLARADVDIAARNADRVTGTLLTAEERDTVRYDVPKGAVLTISAKGKKRKGAATPIPTFRVLDPALAEAAPFQPVVGSGAKLRGFPVTATGTWSVEVRGESGLPGDYSLSVAWKSPTRIPFVGDLPAGGTIALPVAVDAGATARFEVRAAPGSAALPRIVRIRDAGGGFSIPFDPPAPGATSHRSPKVRLPVGGDLVLEVTDTGAAGGGITGTATVKPPKPKPRSIAVTSKQIGDLGVETAAIGAILDAGGGSLIVDDPTLAIDCSSVTLLPGALTAPTAIVIGTSPDLAPPGDLDGAGPAVFFGPDGTKFDEGKPATIMIPLDFGAIGGDTSAVRIFTRDAKGKVREVLPRSAYVFDPVAETVAFPAPHFSSFQAFAPAATRVRGDFDGDGVADLLIPASNAGGVGRVYVFRGGGSLPSSATSATADVVLSGTTSGDELGHTLAAVDVNGDGVDDLCAGLRGGTRRLVVWLGGPQFLAGGAPDLTVSPTAADPNLGIDAAGGDLNGDGVEDLVVGDESNNRGVSGAGGLFVFFGPVTADLDTDDADVVLTGEGTGDLFGASLAVGDVISGAGDGGVADLVVGADRADVVPLAPGKVYVFRGPLAPGTRSASTAEAILVGAAASDGFGLPVRLGDVDGGGVLDVVVSAAGADTGSPDAPGSVIVFRGEAGIGTPSGDTPFATLTGAFSGDRLGLSLAVGDFTGGDVDVAAGIPGDDGAFTDAGSVAFWFGTTTGTAEAAPGRLPRVSGPAVGHALGSQFVATADVNGDGRDDLIVGNSADLTNGVDAGACHVWFGRATGFPPSGPDVTILGAAGEQLGLAGN